jgi:hypothetical protein
MWVLTGAHLFLEAVTILTAFLAITSLPRPARFRKNGRHRRSLTKG